jgi:hypothetical protein
VRANPRAMPSIVVVIAMNEMRGNDWVGQARNHDSTTLLQRCHECQFVKAEEKPFSRMNSKSNTIHYSGLNDVAMLATTTRCNNGA